MPRTYVTSRGHSGVSFGCLGSLVAGFATLVVLAVLVVVLFWVAVAVLALAVVGTLAGMLVMTVRRVRGRHTGVQGPQGGTVGVIEGHVVEDRTD